MTLRVIRSNQHIYPDHKKVIPRFFNTGNERSTRIINRLLQMDEKETDRLLQEVFAEFSDRYRNIRPLFIKHYELIKYLIPVELQETLSEEKKLLTGSYFTMEYSIEAAALFNPSMVAAPDQTGAGEGQKKVIVSFRATGESHISSLVFKSGIVEKNGAVNFDPSGEFIGEGTLTQQKKDSKPTFAAMLGQLALPAKIIDAILVQLNDIFTYKEVEVVLKSALMQVASTAMRHKMRYDILNTVNTSYELHFAPGSLVSERVIFPVTRSEKNGIEDARFVRFEEEDGSITYIATYTAYDGSHILPQLIITTDFLHFKIKQLHGRAAINKNLALFPKKINGQYVMLSRIDGINNYIMFSDDLFFWDEAQLLQLPEYPWELIQIGNGGSPIETEKGWLIITHGVGPMRKYCLGASLFDINDPTIQLGRLKQPLLLPNAEEREGYVPNVVYSCGSMVHGDNLIIPYAVSDYASSFATVNLKELLNEILNNE